MTSAEQNAESVPVVEHFDEKSPERYRELLAAAVAAYGTDAVKFELRAADDGTVSFICTAKSKVDEYELARVVGEVVKRAVSSIRYTELEEQVKRLEARIRELTEPRPLESAPIDEFVLLIDSDESVFVARPRILSERLGHEWDTWTGGDTVELEPTSLGGDFVGWLPLPLGQGLSERFVHGVIVFDGLGYEVRRREDSSVVQFREDGGEWRAVDDELPRDFIDAVLGWAKGGAS